MRIFKITVLLGAIFMAAPAFAQKQGGTLTTVVGGSLLKNFNPYTQAENISLARGFMYESLLFNNSQQNKIEYRLATAYEYADDLKSITYRLRKGAKWSDGKPFTSADVVFSHQLAQKHPQLDNFALWQADSVGLESVEAVDEHRVRFNLTRPDSSAYLLISQHYIVPRHVWAAIENPVTFVNEEPVGSGPFTTIKNFKPQQMIACRNPHYWDPGKPFIDCIKLRQYQNIQAALIRNEIDWGSAFIADIEKTFVAKDPQNNHFWYPPGVAVSIHLNTARKPFDDLRFRQAFSYAINRPEIVDLATYGYASVNPHITGIGDLYKAWYDDRINQKFDHLNLYDPGKASALLDEAGYQDRDGDGFREQLDGSPLKFDIMVVNGWSDWVQAVQMVVDYLKDVGVEARTRTVDIGQLFDNLKNQQFDSGIIWGDGGPTPHTFYSTLLDSSHKGVTAQANHGVYSADTDALLKEFTRTGNKSRQMEIIGQLQEYVAQNLMIIPMFSNPIWYQYSTRRFIGWPSAEHPYVNPSFYEAGSRTLLINNLYLK